MKQDLESTARVHQREKEKPDPPAEQGPYSPERRSVADRVLALQRIIGNQATQRLVRVRNDTCEKHAEHVVLFRSSDPLSYGPSATDVPKQYPVGSSEVAFDPGAVVGGETASQLDQILSNSQFLKPYIEDKLKRKSISQAGKFVIHASDSEFDLAYMTLHHELDDLNNPAFRKELEMKKGFYWEPEDTIHLRPLSDMSQALHEAIHKFSEAGFNSMFGKFVNEGTTQYFADKVQAELGFPPAGSHGYGRELAFATDLIAYLDESFIAVHYFKDFDALTILDKLGLTFAEYDEKYRFGEAAKAHFLRYLRKLI